MQGQNGRRKYVVYIIAKVQWKGLGFEFTTPSPPPPLSPTLPLSSTPGIKLDAQTTARKRKPIGNVNIRRLSLYVKLQIWRRCPQLNAPETKISITVCHRSLTIIYFMLFFFLSVFMFQPLFVGTLIRRFLCINCYALSKSIEYTYVNPTFLHIHEVLTW